MRFEFGRNWRRFVEGVDESRILKAKESLEEMLGEGSLEGRRFLDAGCGMGRHLEVVVRAGGKAIAFDLSDGIERAKNLLSGYDCKIFKADIYNLPFEKEQFDFVYSIGVLDHTADPKKAFECLAPLVKKGGEIAIWAHNRFPKIKEVWFDFLRIITSRLPLRFLHFICLISIPKGYIEIILRKTLLTKPLAFFLSLLFPVSNHPDPQIRVTDTFNWHAPRFQHFLSEKEMKRWFKKANLKILKVSALPVGVLGRKE